MINKKIQIWCTLGPSSLNKRVIQRLDEAGVSIFRINLSHTNIEDVEKNILKIKEYTSVPICLDTEGPQIRTGNIIDGKTLLKQYSKVNILKEEIIKNAKGKGNVKENMKKTKVQAWGLSSNFRSGKAGGWRKEMSSAHIKKCKKLLGQSLIKLGYEKDLDW